jgi:hypothetical protein
VWEDQKVDIVTKVNLILKQVDNSRDLYIENQKKRELYNWEYLHSEINKLEKKKMVLLVDTPWKEQNNIHDIKIYKFDTNNSYIDYSTISIFDGKMINNSNKSSISPIISLGLFEQIEKFKKLINY